MAKPEYNKLDSTKNQVDQVVLIMKDNIEKVLQRDEKLNNIETRAEELQDGAQRFQKISTKLKQKMFCKNMRFIMVLTMIFLILIMIILLIIFKK
jgi:vesicle-associated membrane protein 2